ncbi:restriction endonuclease subunit S [uncultured Acinetobacter sp.]|uniref:restriction endonuclease subunit S n=1 Tax=uncultured Acinetobacter sp. TaxID=165433 RepID=UPI0025837510|nr:restriction endonuclease subunit S [uncultured Acinetobacter sp.]
MNKQKKELVPELRFPEFEKEPNWPCVKLNTVARRSTSKNKGEKVTRVLTNSAVDGVVDQRDYFDKDIAVKGNLEGYYIVDKGDYVYNPRISSTAPVGPISKNKVGKGVMSPLYTVFRFNSKNNDFFEQFFNSSRWHGYLQTISNSGARHDRMSITSGEFMAMPVPNPFELEQKKIADCLASIDELITLHTRKLDALKDHKKGLLQQLFPAEGETIPKLRFHGFGEKKPWKAVCVGDLGKVITGSTPSTNTPEYYDGPYLFVSPADISDFRFVENTKTTLSKLGFEKTRHVKSGSILFVCIGSTIGKVAQNRFQCATNQQINSIIPLGEFSNDFLYYLLSNESTRISKMAGKQAVPLINKTTFSSISMLVPEKDEQEVIANILSELDELIFEQSQKIGSLKDHRSGLLQKLFPIMDEVL